MLLQALTTENGVERSWQRGRRAVGTREAYAISLTETTGEGSWRVISSSWQVVLWACGQWQRSWHSGGYVVLGFFRHKRLIRRVGFVRVIWSVPECKVGKAGTKGTWSTHWRLRGRKCRCATSLYIMPLHWRETVVGGSLRASRDWRSTGAKLFITSR